MNVGDTVKNSNSWHWLAAVVALSAAGSAFVPTYGWKDAIAHRGRTLAPREEQAAKRLAELKSLDEQEAEAAQKKSAELRAETAKARTAFAAYGFEAMPEGEDAVFTAQGRINGALAKHHIQILSNDARVAEAAKAPSVAPAMAKAVKPAAQPTMTAAEFRRQIEQQASQFKDKAVREMFLSDARRKLAAMEAEEKRKGASPRAAERPAAPRPAAAPAPRAAAVKPPFRTTEVDYRAAGDFRDAFMFFVEETHVRANHAFKDISVRRNGDKGMDISFKLLVSYR